MAQIKGRITLKKFGEFVNREFERIGMPNIKVVEVFRTRYTSDQYERGASFLIVTVNDINFPDSLVSFNCSYRLSDYQDYINKGYEMFLTFCYGYNNRTAGIAQMEVELRKK